MTTNDRIEDVTIESIDDEMNKEDGDMEMEKNNSRWVKIAVVVGLLVVIVYLICDYTIPELGYIRAVIIDFLEWVEENPALGAFAYGGVYVVTTLLLVPGSLLTIGAGLVFGQALGIGYGVLVGSITVYVGAVIGAIASFLLGRYVFREWTAKKLLKYKVMKAVDIAIAREGKKIVTLFRLSPLIPFNVFNYLMGVTRISFGDYCFGFIGMLPGTVGYVFIGTSASGIIDSGTSASNDDPDDDDNDNTTEIIRIVLLVVGIVSTVVAVIIISRYAWKILKTAIDNEEGEEEISKNEDNEENEENEQV